MMAASDSSSVHLTQIPLTVVTGFQSGKHTNLFCPLGICVDSEGAMIVADTGNHRICKITSSGIVTTIAGSQGKVGHRDGKSTLQALFHSPLGVCVGEDGTIYVSEFHNHRIRRISRDGYVSTIAGSGLIGFVDGTSSHAQFNHPWGIAVDKRNNVYVADSDNHSVRMVSPCGFVTTVAGCGSAGFRDGSTVTAMFNSPVGVCVSSTGEVFATDTLNHRIRRIDIANGQVFTLAGSANCGFQDGTGS
jgi:sugar lactone lactonase YvrE